MFGSLEDCSGTMLIQNLITMFSDGQITLDEMWEIIEKDMRCQEFGSRCIGAPNICPCGQEPIHN